MVKALGKALYRKDMPQYQPGDPLVPDSDADLNAVIWGDPQISLLSPLRAARLCCALRDIRKAKGKYDALILAGDITEYGAECEYKMTSALLSRAADRFDAVLAVPGNHDVRLRRYAKQVARFNAFMDSVKGGVHSDGASYYHLRDINGYRFIMLGADKTAFEGSYLSAQTLQRLDADIAAADPAKPVFVVNHQPLKLTNGLPLTFLGKGKWRGSVGNQSDALRAVFEKHRNVVYLTGHLHYCTSRYTYENCGRFYAVSAPTVGVVNHAMEKVFTQGLVMTVKGGNVRFRARVFGEGRYFDKSLPGAEFAIDFS